MQRKEMIMEYRRCDIVAWLRDLSERSDDEELDEDARVRLFLREGAERFPKMIKDELAAAIEAHKLEMAAELEAEEEKLRELEFMMAFCAKHNLPRDVSWAEGVRMVAERGDPEAQEILRELNSPDRAVADALLRAAVEAHPAWSCEGRMFLFNPEVGGPEDGLSLIDWYQRTHPRDASAITDRILSAA